MDTSSAQRRAMTLLGIPWTPQLARHSAIERLTKAGAPGDGVPTGYTWRNAARLTDDELLNLLQGEQAT